ILTRSPARSDSTSASLSGVLISLIPSGDVVTPMLPPAPPRGGSQRHLVVTVRVAFAGHGDGERGDGEEVRQLVDAERGRAPAVALGAAPEPIRAVQELHLKRIQGRIRIR